MRGSSRQLFPSLYKNPRLHLIQHILNHCDIFKQAKQRAFCQFSHKWQVKDSLRIQFEFGSVSRSLLNTLFFLWFVFPDEMPGRWSFPTRKRNETWKITQSQRRGWKSITFFFFHHYQLNLTVKPSSHLTWSSTCLRTNRFFDCLLFLRCSLADLGLLIHHRRTRSHSLPVRAFMHLDHQNTVARCHLVVPLQTPETEWWELCFFKAAHTLTHT